MLVFRSKVISPEISIFSYGIRKIVPWISTIPKPRTDPTLKTYMWKPGPRLIVFTALCTLVNLTLWRTTSRDTKRARYHFAGKCAGFPVDEYRIVSHTYWDLPTEKAWNKFGSQAGLKTQQPIKWRISLFARVRKTVRPIRCRELCFLTCEP